jgi:two-component system, NtrC family, nitrogen regulation response regulator NtrX
MLKNKISILIVDDEIDICNTVSAILSDEGYKTITAFNSIDAVSIIKKNDITLIITDIWMNNNVNAGLDLLTWCQNYNILIPVIMMSGHGSVETAMVAAKNGAYDFVEKPFKTDRLLFLVDKALNERNLKIKVFDFESKENQKIDLIGKSVVIKNIKLLLNKISNTNSRVLITGPSGSGKELCARFIHKKSNRKKYPFIVASCATLSPGRVEQVLFGWDDHPLNTLENNQSNLGLFEQANHGTLYFDEICDLPIETQGKLMQAIQEQSFYRIGSNKKIFVDVRIISASNKNLNDSINKGNLREDLFYRLSVAPIEMPSLKSRIEDIPHLIEYFIISLSKDLGKNVLNFSPDTLALFQTYDWPGNLRQLKNILEWLLIMYGDNVENLIKPSNLPLEFLGYNKSIEQDNYNLSNDLDLQLKDARKIFEANYLKSQLIRFKGNISRTSNFVGMDRSALHRKLKELNININEIS